MIEIKLINNLLIGVPGKVLQPLFCQRDEIASPEKLKALLNIKNRDGIFTDNANNNFHYIRVPWIKEYREGIHSTNFYILTNNRLMFNVKPTVNLSMWLEYWGHQTFLVTTPVFNKDGFKYICKHTYPESIIHIYDETYSELTYLINNKSYTICNGYIYMLALYRLGILKEKAIIKALQDNYVANSYYHYVYIEWQSLYYGNVIPHIADFPYMYGTSQLSLNLINLLKPDIFPFNFIISLNNNLIVQTFESTMFPDFNISNWKALSKKNWPRRNIIPDIPGFIDAIMKNKKTWRWWNLNKKDYLEVLRNNSKDILYYIFYKYYISANGHRKLRHLYKDIITNNDQLNDFVRTYLIKVRLNRLLNSCFSLSDIPIQFIVDYMYNIKLFDTSLFTNLSQPIILIRSFDIIKWTHIDIYSFIRYDYKLYCVFERKIMNNLCKYYILFGMGRRKNALGINEYRAYNIGNLILLTLKNKRSHLEYLLY